MKITFVGNFTVDYSSETHYLKTLRKMGHEIFTFQENTSDAESILKSALNSNMLFQVHTHGDLWKIKGMTEVYKILKEKGIPTVGYHLDLFKGIGREPDKNKDEYWNIEYFFTCDKNFIPDLEALGIKAYYLPAGVFEDECYFGTPREEFKYDVIFTGSKGYHHEWPYRPQLIEWLQSTYGERFAHFGGDGKGTIRGKDLNDLYASAKIVVGDTLCQNFNYPYYYSDRLFEVTGRGGFLIFPYIKGIEDLFQIRDGQKLPLPKPQELVTYHFNFLDGLENGINYFLEHQEEREKIRLAGHERTKRDHTYTKRLQFILDTLFSK